MCDMGIDRKLWRIIINSFQGYKCCVSIGGVNSEFFEPELGLHQGAPFSMLGYCLFSEMLLRPLTKSQYSIHIQDICLSCPAYADDLTLIAVSARGLQKLLDIVHDFSNKWRLSFNHTKCKILVYGTDRSSMTKFYLGQEEIERCTVHTHVGTVMSPYSKEITNYMKKKIDKCKQISYAIPAIGTKNAPVTPICSSHVFNSICISKLLYGCEMMSFSSGLITEMESYQASVSKMFQELPENACNLGAIHTMGWLSIQSRIDYNKLIFLWRLICLPMCNIYKRLLLKRYCYITCDQRGKVYGPLQNFLQVAEKYGLTDTIVQALESGSDVSLSNWKKYVKNLVTQRDERLWLVNSQLYRSLDMLRISMSRLCVNNWWIFVQNNPEYFYKCKIIMRIMFYVSDLNSCKSRYVGANSSLCQICDDYCHEDICHFMFQCKSLECVRYTLWNEVMNSCPSRILREEISSMNIKDRSIFIISGLMNSYSTEWNTFFCSICNFIYKLYSVRSSLINT